MITNQEVSASVSVCDSAVTSCFDAKNCVAQITETKHSATPTPSLARGPAASTIEEGGPEESTPQSTRQAGSAPAGISGLANFQFVNAFARVLSGRSFTSYNNVRAKQEVDRMAFRKSFEMNYSA